MPAKVKIAVSSETLTYERFTVELEQSERLAILDGVVGALQTMKMVPISDVVGSLTRDQIVSSLTKTISILRGEEWADNG